MQNMEKYMRRALHLALNGAGHVSPNPMVGCVIVDANDTIIGEGWHRRYGEAHAEVNAINSVTETDKPRLHGATMYVTLEPCSHYGKTPPCADMVAASEISKVVIATSDPNPKVAGRGIQKLKTAGKEVIIGILEDEARYINRRFFTAQIHPRPYITLKWACDAAGNMGFAAPLLKKSSFYSNQLSRMQVHRLRSLHDAIMVGARTAAADNPSLDVRYWVGNNPQPIILRDSDIDLSTLLLNLRNQGITSLLVEGGATLLNSFINASLYDEIYIERTPTVLPGNLKAPSNPAMEDLHYLIRDNIITRSMVKKT